MSVNIKYNVFSKYTFLFLMCKHWSSEQENLSFEAVKELVDFTYHIAIVLYSLNFK